MVRVRSPNRGRDPTGSRATVSPVRKLFVAIAIAALMALIFLVAGTAQNQGCLPWKQAIHVGGSAFSEGDRGRTVCR